MRVYRLYLRGGMSVLSPAPARGRGALGDAQVPRVHSLGHAPPSQRTATIISCLLFALLSTLP